MADSFEVEPEAEPTFEVWLDEYFKKPATERLALELKLNGRLRHETRDSGNVTRVQPRVQLKAAYNITSDGCLKAVGSVGTGPGYSSHWDDVKTGTRDEDYNFSIDSFYFDYELCDIANAHIEVGAMPNNNVGILGPDSDGYIDGARIRYTTPSGETKWVITAGHLEDFDTRNFFERDFNGVNFKRATVEHSLNDKIKLISDVIEHMDNIYVRACASFKLNHLTGLVDEIHAEDGWVEGQQQSMILRLKKKYDKWNIELSGSRIEDFQGAGEQIPIDSFYGDGSDGEARNNGQLKVSWKMYKSCNWVARIRAGQSPTRTEFGFTCKYN